MAPFGSGWGTVGGDEVTPVAGLISSILVAGFSSFCIFYAVDEANYSYLAY